MMAANRTGADPGYMVPPATTNNRVNTGATAAGAPAYGPTPHVMTNRIDTTGSAANGMQTASPAYAPPAVPPNNQHGANAPFAGNVNSYNYQGWGPGARQQHQQANAAAAAAAAAPKDPYGSQSGPGILEDWFNQRASGTDPGYEYAMERGGDAIDNRMAAGGTFNSGARGQQLSDYAANMGAQREGQLDTLAAGASGEHQNRLNSMFNQGNALAGGESGINSAYDLAAGKVQSDALSALLGYQTDKAGVDSQANQGLVNNAFGLASSIYGGKKK